MKRVSPIVTVLFVLASCSSKDRRETQDNRFIPVRDVETILVSTQSASPCPKNMVLVDGEYCPEVEEICLAWSDGHGESVPNPPQKRTPRDWSVSNKCMEYQAPSRCLSIHTVHKRYCVDRFEYPNVEGQVPQSWMTWHDVKSACESQGKRLCTESEWTFACEGIFMQPYPYGDGYHRDSTSCNTDNRAPKGVNVMKVTSQGSEGGKALDAMLMPAGSMPGCVSPFGVHDMPGNIDEFVLHESGHPYKSGLVGGHVFGVRNNCRASTDGHNEQFSWYETGGRCCSDTTPPTQKVTP